MLSSTGRVGIITGSGGAMRSGSWRGGSAFMSSAGASACGALSAGTLPPRSTSASLARSSSFSWISRSSSASTSSRKASTSSSSYPGRSLVVLNCLFRTSAGVSGISSPRRTWTVFLTTVPESKARHSHLQQDQYHDEQNHEAEIQGYHTEPEGRDEAAQEFQGRVCDREDTLGDHQQYA